ncbi:MAG: sensor histidine kinase [Magnetovibrio sp.]|nr:sensor histidine kinase [Magnetovibrio sp.]
MVTMDHPQDATDFKAHKPSRINWLWLLALPVLLVGFYGGAKSWLTSSLYDDSNRTLGLYTAGLEELLGKFHPLPQIYALHPHIQKMLKNPDNQILRHDVNTLLMKVNQASSAAETYVLDTTGMTLAASNWNKQVTFVGRSFSYRPYYQDAMENGHGQFFALDTTSLQRGYYLSSAIVDEAQKTIGVVVVKVDVAQAELGWNAPDHDVIVTDEAGIVFLSSRREWLYTALSDPSLEALATLGETRRYADKKIGRMPFKINNASSPWAKSFEPQRRSNPTYLATHQDIAGAGWRVWILADTAAMLNTALAYAGAIVLVIALAAIAVVSLIERRRGLLRALSVQHNARRILENSAVELEHQVEKRTADLKRTQNELVQAGKMAALGQMSVGINHELNQPLTAIRSYAHNAHKFLQFGRMDEARDNMSLISALSERMGDIILRLKIFARESSDERTPQNLQAVIQDTLRIVGPRLKKDRVKLNIDVHDHDITVLVNNVRLEQVLVNLINNAADAFEGDGERRIQLSATTDKKDAVVKVQDTGPGIPEDVIDHLFEPFFTTKDVGIGLGLGLSISFGIIHEFGGELSARNLEDGGAEFTFNIPLSIPLANKDEA